MVGKRSISQSIKRHGHSTVRRPKRNVPVKNIDDTVGLSKKEEKELKKALYASLQDTKLKVTYTYETVVDRKVVSKSNTPPSGLFEGPTRRSSSALVSSKVPSIDESSQDSLKSYTSTNTTATITSTTEPFRTKVHAQRKFAQGSLPVTPSTTPVKSTTSPFKLLPKTAKTEDFLTFLCLRGTSVLPPHLDFLNFSREESGDCSRPDTPAGSNSSKTSKPGEVTRESTPESSSASSNDELQQLRTPPPNLRNGGANSALRKAARASAGTPETARGIVSLRQGLSRKVSSLAHTPPTPRSRRILCTPEKTPTSSRSTHTRKRLSTNSPSGRDGVKSLSHSFSKYSPTGKLAIKRKALLASKLAAGTKKSLKGSLSDSSLLASKKHKGKKSPHGTFKPLQPIGKKKPKNASKESSKGKVLRTRHVRTSTSSDQASDSLYENTPSKSPRRNKRNSDSSEDYSCQPSSKKIPKRRSSSRIRSISHSMSKRPKRQVSEDDDVFFDIDDPEDDDVVVTSKKRGRPKGSKNKKHFGKGMATRRSSTSLIQDKKVSSLAKLAAKKKQAAVKTLKKSAIKEQSKLANIIEKRRKPKVSNSTSSEVESTKLCSTPSTSKKSPAKLSPRINTKTGSPRRASASERSVQFKPFPTGSQKAEIVDVPIFYPSEQEFRDPITYIESIKSTAEPYGMCKIVPPQSWKPECRINEEMRFTAQVQYIHKLYKRWGPNVEKTACILQHLKHIGVEYDSVPKVGSVELDLAQLSQVIQEHGGMQNVIDKKKWIKIADILQLPKMAVDRGTKLFDAYCKYLLPYDTLSAEEKKKIKQQVMAEKKKKDHQNEHDEAIVKGKSNPLSTFIRVARNVQSMWFKDEPTVEEVEEEYWKVVEDSKQHVTVQCGHVNTRTQGTAFPAKRDNPYFRHSWNLNNLPQNPKSLLKVLGPITGTTIPTLHIGMLYATSCWSCNPHNLPYIQYLHSGADIIWYSVPKQLENKFKTAMTDLTPTLISDDPQWLKEDVVMVNPNLLVQKDVSVGKCIQKPRQFMVIFDKSYTATVSCGYNVSESAHYATSDWLQLGMKAAQDLNESLERELFSMDNLLYCLAMGDSIDRETLALSLKYLEKIVNEEISLRRQLYEAGVKIFERMAVTDDVMMSAYPRKRAQDLIDTDENVCDISKKICYLSMVTHDAEKTILCPKEALKHPNRKKYVKSWRLLYRYTDNELKTLVENTRKKLTEGNGMSGKKRVKKS